MFSSDRFCRRCRTAARVFLTGILLSGIPSLLADGPAEKREMPWAQIAPLVRDKKVEVATSEGAVLEGRVIQVTEEGIALKVQETTHPHLYPKGSLTLPRRNVLTLQMTQRAGKWRTLGTAIGLGAGAVAGWGLAEGVFHTSGETDGLFREPRAIGLLFGTAAGAGALGFILGRRADQRSLQLVVTP